MPTYDYRCDACGHEFEEFQSMTAKPLRKCPACGKLKLKRLIGTGGAVIFKGSGFWQTDYRSEGYKEAAKKDSDAASGKSDGDKKTSGDSKKESTSTSSESKPAKGESKQASKPKKDK